MKGTFRRVEMTVVPVGSTARDAVLALPDRKIFIGEFHGARNPKQHDLFWSLCDLVADATDDTKENVKKWLCIACGHVEIWYEPNGTMHIDPGSIAWESMKQAEFNQFFQAAVLKIAERLECAPQEVRDRFEELTNPLRGQ